MTESMARRGPDSEGIESWNRAVLGSRRLSIFDLSDAGNQPMVTPDRGVGVVFNGAIYNFRDLRKGLEEAGYEFRSGTDTEVLLHGYSEWGIDGLVSRLRGMFAFGIWDDRTHKLFLARDRLGVKPLLYTLRHGALAFASTASALKFAGLADEIDSNAILEFLEFGYVTDDRTIYKGVAKLHAGSILEWSNDRAEIREYWRPPPIKRQHAPTFAEAVEETERLLLRAVELRLQADVPVGALLSGGVDSSLVCWAASKLGADITAFTIGASGDPLDESPDAIATAGKLGLKQHVIRMLPGDAPGLNDLVSAYGEPFACSSALGILKVSKAVRQSATVLLTGDGGDDCYLGYPEHGYFWLAQRMANIVPSPATRLLHTTSGFVPGRGPLRRARHFLDYATGGLGAVACAHPGLPVYQRLNLLGERLRDARMPHREMTWSQESAKNLMEEFLVYDRRTRFTGEYMTKLDGGSMYYALEARSPFLDQEIWDFASTLPIETRLRGGRLKSILREIAGRRIDSRIARGRKRGFNIPVERWIANGWRPLVQETFQNSMLEREGFIRADAVRTQLAAAAQAGRSSTHLWYLLVLETWMQHENAASAGVRKAVKSQTVIR
jgi:asparagine synthase (glutamine-hydrolysing)